VLFGNREASSSSAYPIRRDHCFWPHLSECHLLYSHSSVTLHRTRSVRQQPSRLYLCTSFFASQLCAWAVGQVRQQTRVRYCGLRRSGIILCFINTLASTCVNTLISHSLKVSISNVCFLREFRALRIGSLSVTATSSLYHSHLSRYGYRCRLPFCAYWRLFVWQLHTHNVADAFAFVLEPYRRIHA
jgi:hypothetical protein